MYNNLEPGLARCGWAREATALCTVTEGKGRGEEDVSWGARGNMQGIKKMYSHFYNIPKADGPGDIIVPGPDLAFDVTV